MKSMAFRIVVCLRNTLEALHGAKRSGLTGALATLALAAAPLASLQAQTGPFSPNDWPPTINANATVDYTVLDPNAAFNSPAGWNNVLSLAGGGDQTYSTITLNGQTGDQTTSTYLNIVDPNYTQFADTPVIDVLLQVYGNSFLYNPDGTGKNVDFLEGQLNYLTGAPAGTIPPGANNGHWNWMLLEVTNAIDAKTGFRYLGDTSYPQQTGGQSGGVNSGTLRLEGIGTGLAVRAIAIGPQGAFGSSNQVNVFASAPVCAPEPDVNLTYVDFNQKVTNNLIVINDVNLGETYETQTGAGPPDDLRTAIYSTSGLMNFGILSNYLGQPCNTPHTMELGIEFYDDPSMAGSTFGPSQYATDAQGDLATYTGSPYTMAGSGKWLKVAFYINQVDLEGAGTSPLTGGPTLIFNGAFPMIDRVELGVIREGTNALAGQIPAPDYRINPLICDTNYGYYAEWDPHDGITNNLDVGTSGGDQQMVVQMAGPTNDQRLAEAPAPGSGNNNIQFALLNQAFGPNLQDNSHVSMVLTYYDDPALAGAKLAPNAYYSLVNGTPTIIGAPHAPYNVSVTLKGTGKWQDAYFELPDVNFQGVNQGPQSVVRFQTTPADPNNKDTGDIFVSRVRFDVIRPCGPFEGINMLQPAGITAGTNANVNVQWFGTATLQSATNLTGSYNSVLSITNHQANTYTEPTTNSANFFRLKYPPYPPYLGTNAP